MIRLLLAENMNLIRAALVCLLSTEIDIEVVADVECNRRAISSAVNLSPDIALISTDPPETSGLAAIHELRVQSPGCHVIVLTSVRPIKLLQSIVASDVSGLIDKNAPAHRLFNVIRGVANGDTIIDVNLAIAAISARQSPLTSRESMVLQLAAEGVTGEQIAEKLSLSPGTVRNYLSHAMNKAGARTRIEAIRIATESGWL